MNLCLTVNVYKPDIYIHLQICNCW